MHRYYPSGAPEFIPGFQWASCYFSFICMFCRSLFVLLYFFFWTLIVLSVLLRYADSDYPFGIFKFFSHPPKQTKNNNKKHNMTTINTNSI